MVARGLEVITGPMFSGKSRELINRLVTYQLGDIKVQAFKSMLDIERYGSNIKAHDGIEFPGIPIKTSDELFRHIKEDTQVLGIDEVQFFDDGIVDLVLDQVYNKGRLVIVTFLNTDFRGEPFRFKKRVNLEEISERSVAELMVRVTSKESQIREAVCRYKFGGRTCGKSAQYTQRLFPDGRPVPYSDHLIFVGGKDPMNDRKYEARCIDHHFVPSRPDIIFVPLSMPIIDSSSD